MKKCYPCMGQIEHRRKNTQAKCQCGELGVARIHIQVNWFRGDDEVKWACQKHFHAIGFLLGGEENLFE